MNKINSNHWFQISIIDSLALPGKSIADIIQLFLNIIDFRFTVVDDIYGAYISAIVEKENTILEIHNLLEMLPAVKQFDWGDFFLFKDYPTKWSNSKLDFYPQIIAQTDTTIRAIDDTYIYVYTPYRILVELIEKNYEIEFIKTNSLEHLDYPE